ncbi:hypothetical protein F53441_7993 [Fusarium austroafricanum]|uniref:Peptide hydrolase n=1 Tax=Fusarium austroafricanum TaxID=2364996 RepID=A0A8H4KDU3_9HYPO|nr:hypothetical protein F53441_7993 [Fusarium austroafricanum]
MRFTTLSLPLLALGASAHKKPLVNEHKLQKDVNIKDLMAGAQKLQDIAEANGNTRVFGGAGHNATVDYLYKTLKATNYYNVKKQPFTELYSAGTADLKVAGEKVQAGIMTYTPAGKASGPLVVAKNLGCDAADFPAESKGNVVLVLRGECPFSQKSSNGKKAGASAVIVYNNVPGELSGTLGAPFGDFAPIVGISQEDGKAILAKIKAGEVKVDLKVDSVVENRVTYNVIAETKEGDHDNVLVVGGHSDSVAAGPGINDDGSGIIGILNVAKALTKYRVKNAVRFGFWSAEEFGLLGSYAYMKSINGSDAEVAKIRAYLNFDMIASPNYIYGIYDGDGSAFNLTGPKGSDAIEKDFERFFKSKKLSSVPSEFSGRSDYAAFIENGVPSGGLFTGAEVLKTKEEAKMFGGEAGVAYDINYHKAGDTIKNLNKEAFLVNTQAIANSVAKYAKSWKGLPRVTHNTRRWDAEVAQVLKRSSGHSHAGGYQHGHAAESGAAYADVTRISLFHTWQTTPTMEQTFFFVDGLHADKSSKKLMRRHVMKGKNAGKTFHRPSRANHAQYQRIPRPFATQFFNFPFPVPVTKVAGKAIDDFFNLTTGLVYPVQLGFPLEKDKIKWLEIMFQDKASYDCSLALIQASNETYLGAGNSTPQFMSCLSQILDQLKTRLNSKDALSDHTLSVVVALIIQEQVAGHYSAAEAHMSGLKTIVDLRGGLEEIKDGIVALKICRTDIMFTMQQGGHPLFHRDHMDQILGVLASQGIELEGDLDIYSIRQERLEPALQQTFFDAMGICRLFNKINRMDEKPLDFLEFQEALASISYRLLQFQPIDESRSKRDIQSAYHLGLSLFMMSIYWHNTQHRLARPGFVAALVKDVLGMLDRYEDEFAFWVLILGGFLTAKDEREWRLQKLREKAEALGIVTWDEVKMFLEKFPWLNAIHDGPGRKLWDDVSS